METQEQYEARMLRLRSQSCYRPTPPIAKPRRSVIDQPIISAEAKQVAMEHVVWCADQGMTPSEVLASCGLRASSFAETMWGGVINAIALHWQDQIAPASREIDAERGSRMRLGKMPAKPVVIGGRVIRATGQQR